MDWPRAGVPCAECGVTEEVLERDPQGRLICVPCLDHRMQGHPWTLTASDRKLLRALKITVE
jgi:hypothetical protein